MSVSGNGTNSAPHDPLSENVLSITESFRPPETVIPVPTGPAPAKPVSGTFGLLLSVSLLSRKTQHDVVWVIPLTPLPGHVPGLGRWWITAIWVLVSKPS